MQTLDVYEDGAPKPRWRVRLPKDFSLARLDFTSGWVVVPTEDGGEIALGLECTSRLVIRDRTEHDERSYEEQQKQKVVSPE